MKVSNIKQPSIFDVIQPKIDELREKYLDITEIERNPSIQAKIKAAEERGENIRVSKETGLLCKDNDTLEEFAKRNGLYFNPNQR